jgi:hypothetical protein
MHSVREAIFTMCLQSVRLPTGAHLDDFFLSFDFMCCVFCEPTLHLLRIATGFLSFLVRFCHSFQCPLFYSALVRLPTHHRQGASGREQSLGHFGSCLVSSLHGNAAAAHDGGTVTSLERLEQETADQAIERNTSNIGLASVLQNKKADNSRIAAPSSH